MSEQKYEVTVYWTRRNVQPPEVHTFDSLESAKEFFYGQQEAGTHFCSISKIVTEVKDDN